jgi:phosphate transport system ATP-binding protein
MDRIRGHLLDMAALGERSLRQCMDAMLRGDRPLAYAVILRDLFIDEQEKAIDRLCLEFLVRQQPAGEALRCAFGAIKINLELERVGDCAESIARQIVKLVSTEAPYPKDAFVEISGLAIPMLRDAILSFVDRHADLARHVIEREEAVDLLKRQINARLVELFKEGRLPLEAREIFAVIGPAQSGKTSLLRCLNRTIDFTAHAVVRGEIRVDGVDVRRLRNVGELRRKIGMVAPLPVGLWNDLKDRLRDKATALQLEQQQKLCIARLLPLKPQILLMDEPCSALDVDGTRAIEELMFELKGRYTILIVTHNMSQARRASDECIFMLMGELIEQRRTEDLFLSPADPRTADYIEGRYG